MVPPRILDVVEGIVDINAAAPRLTDWLASGYDWLVLRDATVTPRATGLRMEVPLVRVNLARVECLVDEDDHVRDERFVVPRVPARIDTRLTLLPGGRDETASPRTARTRIIGPVARRQASSGRGSRSKSGADPQP